MLNADSDKSMNVDDFVSETANGTSHTCQTKKETVVEVTRTTTERSSQPQGNVMLFVTLYSIGDAVITTNDCGDVDFLNPMAEALTGWSLQDAVTENIENIFKLIDEKSGEELPNPARQALETKTKVSIPSDSILVRKDGSGIPIDDSASPIIGENDELLGAILVFRDVSERKLAEQTIKYRSELDRMVAQISTAFITSAVSQVDSMIDAALKKIGQFLEVDRIYVFLYDITSTTMTCAYEWCAPEVESIFNLTLPITVAPYWTREIYKQHPILVSSEQDIPENARAEKLLWVRKNVKSFIGVPMSQEDRVLGFLAMDSIHKTKKWPEEMVNMLGVVGNVFASAMGRRDAQHKLLAAREREVEIAYGIQRNLLLSNPPLSSSNYRIETLTIPSRGVDGDFYDFLLHPNEALDFIFGDVMGKGIPAALLSAGAKTEFLRSLSHLLVSSPRGTIPRPKDIVNGVHNVLTPQLSKLESYVTLTYARFDPQTSKVILVDCGNTKLVRCHQSSGDIEYLTGYNMPLGFSETETYTEAEFSYTPGDIFVLYSDGVTEARNQEGELFGLERLNQIIKSNHLRSPSQIVDSIKQAVTGFVGTGSLNDDLTCVVMQVIPTMVSDSIVVDSNLDQLGDIRAFIRSFCYQYDMCGLTVDELDLVQLAINEVASNIMRHAYRGRQDKHIDIRITKEGKILTLRLTHSGEPFSDDGIVQIPSLDLAKEGGYGLYIINKVLDAVEYGQDVDGNQYVELIKYCADI